MTQIAKITQIFRDSNQDGGRGSESWYVPYTGNDAPLVATANSLSTARAKLLGYGVTINPVRMTVYSVGTAADPTALVKVKSLPVLDTPYGASNWTGYSRTGNAGYLATAPVHTVALRWLVTYANGVSTRMSGFAPPFALTYDYAAGTGAWADATNIATIYNGLMLSYSNALVNAGAFRRLVSYPQRYAISGVSQDTNGNICVQVAGSDLTGVFVPGVKVHVGGRTFPRKTAHYVHDGLNGQHSVLQTNYSGSASLNTICLTCSRYLPSIAGCASQQGFIGLSQHVQQQLLPITQGQAVSVASFRGFPRRGNK